MQEMRRQPANTAYYVTLHQQTTVRQRTPRRPHICICACAPRTATIPPPNKTKQHKRKEFRASSCDASLSWAPTALEMGTTAADASAYAVAEQTGVAHGSGMQQFVTGALPRSQQQQRSIPSQHSHCIPGGGGDGGADGGGGTAGGVEGGGGGKGGGCGGGVGGAGAARGSNPKG